MTEITRIDVFSVAKVLGILYFLAGILVGLLFACSLLIGLSTDSPGFAPARFGSTGFSLAFAICTPFVYALLGFVFGAIGAALYNLIARSLGGIKLELNGYKDE